MMIARRICRSLPPAFLSPHAAQTPPQPPLPAAVTGHHHHQQQQQQQQQQRPLAGSSSPLPFSSYNFVDVLSFGNKVNKCCFSTQALSDAPVGAMVDVPLAQTGEGIAECELLKWFVQEGDQVDEFQPLCEVQSDKATIEITSRYKGKVAHVLYVPGDIVKVGETLLRMVVEDSLVTALPQDSFNDEKSLDSEVNKTKTLDSEVNKTKTLDSEVNKTKTCGVLSTPAVRHLAKQYGIKLEDVQGTGKEGRILKEDVLRYAIQKGNIKDSSKTASADSGDQLLGGEENYEYASAKVSHQHDDKTVPLRGFQRAMVKTMSMAAKVPHFHYVDEINCDALVDLKQSFQKNNNDPGVKHTFLPLLIKSLSVALGQYPWMNSCFNEESMEVNLKGSHNIGIAMATPSGLVVPNIKNVQTLSTLEITKELSRLQQLALANKLNPEDVSGGTITLSNIGAIGGKFGAPLLNLPEVAIIAIGRIQKVAQFTDDGNVYPSSIMTVNIGADHRVLDGATVARFCNEWKQLIEKPELLMLLMR